MRHKKAIVLLSGGLDSMLAAAILSEQGFAVEGFAFTSPFFGAEKAEAAAARLGLPLRTVPIGEALIGLVKDPPSGLGENMNPCVDCHALMLRLAAEAAQQAGGAVVATGEVLGQRPFSQTKDALNRVAKLAGTEVLRPLSALLLKPTSWEESGLVDRSRLLDISGRGRKRQFALAAERGWRDIPNPAGGCLLTDPGYGARLRDALDHCPGLDPDTAKILRYGRPLWIRSASGTAWSLLSIGRDKAENLALAGMKGEDDALYVMKAPPGPTALVRGLKSLAGPLPERIRVMVPKDKYWDTEVVVPGESPGLIAKIGEITAYYSVRARGLAVDLEIVV